MKKTLLALALAAGLLVTAAPASTDPSKKRVNARANIFGAGLTAAPQPGGGGAGWLPPMWQIPRSAGVVTFPRIVGMVSPLDEASFNGAGGGGWGSTDVQSYGGISGIVDGKNGMFLVGVFLTSSPPKRPSPDRLDFTNKERFRVLAPELSQTFFVGDGKDKSYRIPKGATRLFLGFADSYWYQGLPGWYGNNHGSLVVTVEFSR